MDGYILLADGTRLDGEIAGAPTTAVGWLTANTSVVGFQEMATDPAYAGCVLVFTYPEVGNVGVTAAFSESLGVRPAGLVVRVLSERASHYLAENTFESMLTRAGVPCLTGVDTRGLAVHVRRNGEMAAAIAPAGVDPEELGERLRSAGRPEFRPPDTPSPQSAGAGPVVAVIDLGIRRSDLSQLTRCCRPTLLSHDAGAEDVLECEPAGVFISDGPAAAAPPKASVETVRALLGRVPLLGCGLGHVALGVALGCEVGYLKRGHHGANYPVRSLSDGAVEVTAQRHTVLVDRDSAAATSGVEVTLENINDSTVEGIAAADGSALGFQHLLAAPEPGGVNGHIRRFVERLDEP